MEDSEKGQLRIIREGRRAAALLRGSRQLLLQHLSAPNSASGLARKLGLPRQRLNYHLRELEREGLVELVEERRRGNCVERLVRATARAFVISPEAFGALGAGAEREVDRASAGFQIATAARAMREVAILDAAAREDGKRLVTLTLDSEVRFADAQARAAFATGLAEALAELLVRYHAPDAESGRTYRLTAFVHPLPGTPPAEPPAERAAS